MPLKTDDLIFLANHGAGTWPYLRGVGMAPAASDSTDRPLSMVEAWERHADWQTMMTKEQRDEQSARARERLRAMESAAVLAAAISISELLSIVEAIEECQAS